MTQQQREASLVLAAQAGDKQAFGRLTERYEHMAWKLALRMTGSQETARDLTQEAMLQAYLSLSQLNDSSRFASWLYGIVLNVCRNYRRNHKIIALSLEGMLGGVHFDVLPLSSSEPTPHEVAEAHELYTHVLAAVGSLPPRYRQVTLLFYYEQLSLQEIAAILGISVSAIKVRLHRSRARLRDQLASVYEPSDQPPVSTIAIPERKNTMIKVTIADVICDEENQNRSVVLFDEPGQRLMPIWVGPWEADSIAIHLLNHSVPRPLTYEFMARLLTAAGATLEEVRVETLKDITYYAVAKLRTGDTVQEIDARPSDAIALALRLNCPIYVSEEVMEKAGIAIPPEMKAPLQRKGLDTIAQQLEQNLQEFERKLKEQKDAEASQVIAEREEARQKLLAYVFGSEG
jgi:RNA polymerase sigma factor (sigma-70 family)